MAGRSAGEGADTRERGEPATVGVVVLNWNDAAATLECVRSVLECRPRPDGVVVVDNGSDAECYHKLREAQEMLGFDLLRSERNLGYGAGNNIGLRRLASMDRVLILNNDTLVDPDALGALSAAMDAHPRVGVAAPLIVTDDGRVWFGGGSYARLRGQPVHHSFGASEETVRGTGVEPISFATGCAMLIRREVLATAGLLHESFFLYWEDVEYCRRVAKAGWGILFCPEARVVHHRGQSGDALRNLSTTMLYYSTRNRLLYLRSFESGAARATGLLCTVPATLRLVKAVATLRNADRRERVAAVVRGLRDGVRSPRSSTPAPRL